MEKIKLLEFGWIKSIITILLIFVARFLWTVFMPIPGKPTIYNFTSRYDFSISYLSKILFYLLILYLIITIIYTLILKFKK